MKAGTTSLVAVADDGVTTARTSLTSTVVE